MVHAADWIVHTAIGGFAGSFVTPAFAFLLGFATHVILDLYVSEYMPYPFRKYWWWILLQIIVVAGILVLSPAPILFGALGGIAPDIIDGLYGFLTKKGGGINWPCKGWLRASRWNAGELLFFFHKSRPGHSISLWQNIALAAASLLVLLKRKK